MAPGVEFGDLNWIAIAAGIVFNMILGFVWYSPKTPTGKTWIRTTGHKMDQKPAAGEMAKAMGLAVLSAFLIMFVFAHTFVAYEDAYLKDDAGYEMSVLDGVMGAFFTWLGFFVPVLLTGVAFERKPWSLFFVNAGYYFLTLLAIGLFLVFIPK